MGINLIATTVIAAAMGSGCSWAHPGANPYRGEPPAALADFSMPAQTRRQLHALMAAHRYTDIVTITRDAIRGQRRYDDLREMHSGHGQLCHGSVDRSAWNATHEERGLVYCVGEACIIVPTVCNNVSLVTRKPEEGPRLSDADEPIDISPAAGPPPTPKPADVAIAQDSAVVAFAFTPDSPELPGAGEGEDSAGSGGGFSGSPAGGDTGGRGGPVAPGGPVVPPDVPTSPIPEAPTWTLLLAGAALLAAMRRLRG